MKLKVVFGFALLLLAVSQRLEAAPVKVRVAGTIPTLGTLPVWLAKDKGIFTEQGLEVEIIAVSGGLPITSLVGGAVEFADTGPSEGLAAVHKGADLKIVAGTLNAITYSVMGQKGLKGLKDLKGKKIGVGGLFSGSTLVLQEMMALEGMVYPQDYALLRVGGARDRVAALLGGQVDAVTVPIPFNLIAADQGAVRLAEASDYVRYYQNTAVLVRGKWAQENPEVVVRFLRGVIRAMRWIYGNRDGFIDYAAGKLKIKKEYAVAGWESYAGKKVWSIDGSPTKEGLEAAVKHQVRLGFLPEGFQVEKYVDLSYLRKAQRE